MKKYRTSLFCARCKQAAKEREIVFLPNKTGICPKCYNPQEFKPC